MPKRPKNAIWRLAVAHVLTHRGWRVACSQVVAGYFQRRTASAIEASKVSIPVVGSGVGMPMARATTVSVLNVYEVVPVELFRLPFYEAI